MSNYANRSYYTPEHLSTMNLEALRGIRGHVIRSGRSNLEVGRLLTEEINHRTKYTTFNALGTRINCDGPMCREVIEAIARENVGQKIQGV